MRATKSMHSLVCVCVCVDCVSIHGMAGVEGQVSFGEFFRQRTTTGEPHGKHKPWQTDCTMPLSVVHLVRRRTDPVWDQPFRIEVADDSELQDSPLKLEVNIGRQAHLQMHPLVCVCVCLGERG